MRPPFEAWVSLPLAALVAWAALGGLLLPSTYARETSSWAAQGMGQDWVDLLLVAPTLAITGMRALRGSRRAHLVLGGALVYTLYSFLLYALEVHFNSLFLVYCAALGLSFYALLALLFRLLREDARRWYRGPVPARPTGIFLLVIAAGFGLLWLGQILPALLSGRDPSGLREIGLPTNPVHVLDLSLLLPALAFTGASLLRGLSIGFALAPVMLGFNVFMSLAIAGMVLVMQSRSVGPGLGLALLTTGIAVASAALLFAFLSQLIAPGGPGHAPDA
ncbi:MAG TPA: hypothetical protein VFD38_06665 [Myxococcaceae bacterium]|nr:hypothetical protein [Myxococcaceae bacterium]